MITVDRRMEWQRRAAHYLLRSMGAETENDLDFRNIWYSVLSGHNCVDGEDVVRLFWPIKHKLRRYLSNHIWLRCIEHEIARYEEILNAQGKN